MDTTRELVIAHYEEMAEKMPQYAPTRMAELAPGVIAVENASGECDALFDMNEWEFGSSELWGGQDSKSPTLQSRNLNVLEGLGRAPRVSSIFAMVNFARRNISPKKGGVWHDEPIQFEF